MDSEDRGDVRPLWRDADADEKMYDRRLKVLSKECRVFAANSARLEAHCEEKRVQRQALSDVVDDTDGSRAQRLADERRLHEDGLARKDDEIKNLKLEIDAKKADILRERGVADGEIRLIEADLPTCGSGIKDQDDAIADVLLRELFVVELEQKRESDAKVADFQQKIAAEPDAGEQGRLTQEMNDEKKAYEDAVVQRWPDAGKKTLLDAKLVEWNAENPDDLRRDLTQEKEAAEAEKQRLIQEDNRLRTSIDEREARFRDYNDGLNAEIQVI